MGLFDLFKPAWQSKNAEKAEKVVEKLINQVELARVAQKANFPWVRKVAVVKLTDQGVLTYIANNDSDYYVREAAADRLTDKTLSQEIFANIAKSNIGNEERLKAAKKLTDKTLATKLLIDIVDSANNCYLYKEALAGLRDHQEMLADIAQKAKDAN